MCVFHPGAHVLFSIVSPAPLTRGLPSSPSTASGGETYSGRQSREWTSLPSSGAGRHTVLTATAGAHESKGLLEAATWGSTSLPVCTWPEQVRRPSAKTRVREPCTCEEVMARLWMWGRWAGSPHGPLGTWVSPITHSSVTSGVLPAVGTLD